MYSLISVNNMSRNIIRRWFCRHKLRKVGETSFGNVYHCLKCHSILAENTFPGMQTRVYIGEYEDFFDDEGNEKPFSK